MLQIATPYKGILPPWKAGKSSTQKVCFGKGYDLIIPGVKFSSINEPKDLLRGFQTMSPAFTLPE